MRGLGRISAALAVAGMATGAGLGAAPAAFAGSTGGSSYGPGAVYQVELSSNVPGEGFWLWVELDSDGTGTYQEADCIHLGGGHATDAASHDAGDVTWTSSPGALNISGVEIIGGLEAVDLSVALPTSGYGSVTSMTLTWAGGAPIVGAETGSGGPVPAPLILPAHGEVAP
jgi:hypothetical protein